MYTLSSIVIIYYIWTNNYTCFCLLQFFDRILLFAMPPKHQPDFIYLRHVPLRKVHLFTIIQLTCLVLLWVIKASKAAIVFPMMVQKWVHIFVCTTIKVIVLKPFFILHLDMSCITYAMSCVSLKVWCHCQRYIFCTLCSTCQWNCGWAEYSHLQPWRD